MASLCWALGSIEDRTAAAATLASGLRPLAARLLPTMGPRQVANVLWGLGGGAHLDSSSSHTQEYEAEMDLDVAPSQAADPVFGSLKDLTTERAQGS